MVKRWGRLIAGLAIGACLAVAELVYAAIRWPRRWARVLTEVERRRLARWHDVESSPDYDDHDAVKYLALRALVGGVLGGGTLIVQAYGLIVGVLAVVQLVTGVMHPSGLVVVAPLGLVLLYGSLQGLLGVASLERALALRYLGPSEQELLRRRITELAESRAGVVEAVDAERRRIERDLHDGVQQRLVALAMLLGWTRRRPATDRDDLLAQAHDEAQQILNDLREVAWRVYPTVLDNLGLADVLAGVAERAGIPVKLSFTIQDRLPASLETAAYFVASEAVTNAAKHSRADLVTVEIGMRENMVIVRITDNGTGGADPSGSGLSGLARRVAAIDGHLAVTSPDGGPTVVTAELPCG
ncbi:sensor histidine kinase [Kibdelosporangium phytohabitans]|uniref:histidine kinase n=1 Tax=Kibdelosporangium phytohabitans TaxID=860235 RepID=A0A0N9HY04_9PSEU|nr:histidine kinase [Kibdelosporangium phytohabitans]ALG07140.1 ATPase [Kibdelosporangium phytohabitans]MBE1468466.1 signal transduction histidine kinase [Kibdelosporangium phytohabitans]